jgi:hypothetical protein
LAEVGATQSRWVAVRLQVPYDAAEPGSHRIRFVIRTEQLPQSITEKSVFIIPR